MLYLEKYMYIHIHMYIYHQLVKKEIMDLNANNEKYMGGFGGRRLKGAM